MIELILAALREAVASLRCEGRQFSPEQIQRAQAAVDRARTSGSPLAERLQDVVDMMQPEPGPVPFNLGAEDGGGMVN